MSESEHSDDTNQSSAHFSRLSVELQIEIWEYASVGLPIILGRPAIRGLPHACRLSTAMVKYYCRANGYLCGRATTGTPDHQIMRLVERERHSVHRSAWVKRKVKVIGRAE